MDRSARNPTRLVVVLVVCAVGSYVASYLALRSCRSSDTLFGTVSVYRGEREQAVVGRVFAPLISLDARWTGRRWCDRAEERQRQAW